MMMMYKMLHPRDDEDKLYVTRKRRGKVLTSIEDCVDAAIQRLEEYAQKSNERLITAARKSNNSRNNLRTNRKTEITKSRKQK